MQSTLNSLSKHFLNRLKSKNLSAEEYRYAAASVIEKLSTAMLNQVTETWQGRVGFLSNEITTHTQILRNRGKESFIIGKANQFLQESRKHEINSVKEELNQHKYVIVTKPEAYQKFRRYNSDLFHPEGVILHHNFQEYLTSHQISLPSKPFGKKVLDQYRAQRKERALHSAEKELGISGRIINWEEYLRLSSHE